MQKHPFIPICLLRILALLFFLISPIMVFSQGRSIHDRGVVFQGEWYLYHDPTRLILDNPYIYLANGSTVFMLELVQENDGLYPVVRDTLRELIWDEALAEENHLLAFGTHDNLYIAQRCADSLQMIGNAPVDLSGICDISTDSILVTYKDLIDLRDPENPTILWTNPQTMRTGTVILENRLFAQLYEDEPIIVYDITDPCQPVVIDSISGPFERLYNPQTPEIDNRYLLFSTYHSHPLQGPGLLFLSLDSVEDVQDTFWWSWYEHGDSDEDWPGGTGVLNDTLFAMVKLPNYSDNPRLYVFDPDLLPDNPEILQVDLPWDWPRMGINVLTAFDDSLLVVNKKFGAPCIVYNLKNPASPEILFEGERIVDIECLPYYKDFDGQYYLSFPFDQYGAPPDDFEGFFIMDLCSGGAPDTVCIIDNQDVSTPIEAKLCDSLILVRRENDLLLLRFSGNEHETAYRIRRITQDDHPVHDLHRIGDRYFAAVEDTQQVTIFELFEDDYVAIDTVSKREVDYFEIHWSDRGLFFAYEDSLFWYRMNNEEQFEFVDSGPCEAVPYWGSIIVQEEDWLGYYGYLYRLHDDHMELAHIYERPIPNSIPKIQAISDDRIVVFTAETTGGYDTVYRIEDDTYENLEASLISYYEVCALYGDTLWGLGPYRHTRYLITGYSDTPDIATTDLLPDGWILYPPYPNPFNSTATVRFDVPQPSPVRLTLYNLLGQEVQVISNRTYNAGQHVVHLNGTSLASGVYFVSLDTGVQSRVRRLILLK